MKYKRYKKIFSLVLVFMVLLPVFSNTVFAIGEAGLDWSAYDYIGRGKGTNFLTVEHKSTPKKKISVYCFNEMRQTPNGETFSKVTLNNKNIQTPVLLENCDAYINKYDWFTLTESDVREKITHILFRGYRGPENNAEYVITDEDREINARLKAKFPSATDDQLSRGTQIAIWSVTSYFDESTWKYYKGREKIQTEIAEYIVGNENLQPIPDNIQVSFFKPMSDKDVATTGGLQNLIALNFLEDPTKEVKNLNVKKEWGGVASNELPNQPEIQVSVLQNDKEITTLKLNNSNNWQASYIVEGQPTDIYKVKEVNEVDGSIVLNGNTYSVNVSGDVDTGFVVTNTKGGTPDEKIPIDISVKKEWVGISDGEIKNQPEVKVNLKRNGQFVTQLILNNDNNWQVTYTDELSPDAGFPSYEVAEVGNDGVEYGEIHNGGNIELSDKKTYKLNISGDMTDGFTVTNTLEGVSVPPTGGETTPPTGGTTTPPTGGETTPPTGGTTTPPTGGTTTPPTGGTTTPPTGGETTPPTGGTTTPPTGGTTTPPTGGETTPPTEDKKTPSTGENTSPNKESSDKKKPSTPKPNVVNEVESNKNSSSIVDKNKKDDSPKKKTDSSKISYKEDSDNIDITASSSSSEQNFDPGVRKPEDKDKNSKVVKTSDSTKIVFYSSMVLISSLVIGFYIFDKKKK